jgi:murein DD-endopeptidase MepM/ murein hydrolase activator NlpD
MKLLIIFSLIFTISCSQKPAKIIDNSSSFYGKNGYSSKKRLGATNQQSNNSHQVVAGESLYLIARNYNVALRDLISANNLSAPYILKEGEFLKIPTPNYHIVKAGENLYLISRQYNMNLNQLTSLNNLQAPYAIFAGQRLRINNSQGIFENKKSENIAAKKEEKTFFKNPFKKSNKFAWPIKGEIISKFGPKQGGLYNDGINILAPAGSDVRAAKDGVVAYVGNELKGYGNLIIVKHSAGFITAYAHLQNSFVKRGDKVEQGQVIAAVGSSGNAQNAQLYFGIRKGRDALNPISYLD